MKAKWVNIVDSLQGNVDQRHYARRIPGNGEWAAVCAKPELSKKTKKAKAEHPTAKAFAELRCVRRNGRHDMRRLCGRQGNITSLYKGGCTIISNMS